MGQQASTGLTTFNSFWDYFMPLFGAWIADMYLGRFRTIWIAVCVSITGHIILTAPAAPSVVADPDSAIACFIISILVIGIGTGGFQVQYFSIDRRASRVAQAQDQTHEVWRAYYCRSCNHDRSDLSLVLLVRQCWRF